MWASARALVGLLGLAVALAAVNFVAIAGLQRRVRAALLAEVMQPATPLGKWLSPRATVVGYYLGSIVASVAWAQWIGVSAGWVVRAHLARWWGRGWSVMVMGRVGPPGPVT
jgi:hypothetical protein